MTIVIYYAIAVPLQTLIFIIENHVYRKIITVTLWPFLIKAGLSAASHYYIQGFIV